MLKKIQKISVSLSILGLSGCFFNGAMRDNIPPQSSYDTPPNMLYPDSYETISDRMDVTPSNSGTVVVPQSYHMGMMGSPETSKNVDKNWVSSQNPQSYTIQLATDSKASRVANTLYKTPKQERSAEIKTNQGTYTGVYGTYSSYEAAQEKLNSLPEDIRQNAKITPWSNIQHDMGE